MREHDHDILKPEIWLICSKAKTRTSTMVRSKVALYMLPHSSHFSKFPCPFHLQHFTELQLRTRTVD